MNVNWLYLPWDQVIKCDEALLEGQRGVNKEGTERGGVKGGGWAEEGCSEMRENTLA